MSARDEAGSHLRCRAVARRVTPWEMRHRRVAEGELVDHGRLAALLIVDADLRAGVDAPSAASAATSTESAELALLRAAAPAIGHH